MTVKHSIKKLMKLRKEPNESIAQFWHCFHNITFQILEDEMDWKFLIERFQYLLHVFENPKQLESFEPLSTYLGVKASKSKTEKVVVTSDLPSSSHQDEVGKVANQSVELSPPPTPPALDICADLECKPDGCQVISFSQPPSSGTYDPTDYIVLCSLVPNSTFVVQEDQFVDRVGVEHPTCVVIFDEHVWQSE